MADKSACPDRFLSRSIRSYLVTWPQDLGNITTCSATLPSVWDPVSSPYGSTVRPKSRCITYIVAHKNRKESKYPLRANMGGPAGETCKEFGRSLSHR